MFTGLQQCWPWQEAPVFSRKAASTMLTEDKDALKKIQPSFPLPAEPHNASMPINKIYGGFIFFSTKEESSYVTNLILAQNDILI